MVAIVWTYEVKHEYFTAFEQAYAPDGAWAVLFSKSEGFLGVQLFRGNAGIYMTIDSWRSEQDFEAFLAEHVLAYEALDHLTEGWTTSEQLVGRFGLI